jgi:hypothetical protein
VFDCDGAVVELFDLHFIKVSFGLRESFCELFRNSTFLKTIFFSRKFSMVKFSILKKTKKNRKQTN